MNAAILAISCGLLAQAPAGPAYQPRLERSRSAPAAPLDVGAPAAEPPAQNEHAAPVEGGPRQKLSPPELVTEALAAREGEATGKPMTLLTALARGSDRTQQLRIAQAYWRLCTAQADYHWALDQRDKLGRFTHEHTNEPGTLSARASARADVRDMQLVVATAQQELLDLMGAQSDEDPPWATDRPHVGGYDTRYEQIFTNRLPPPRIRLIHRTMPVLRKAIDDHGEAISETLDALETTGDDFQRSGQGLATVLATLDQLKHERRAFMADVRDYNQQIAEYVCAVLPPTADHVTLVSKLIMSPPPGNPPPVRARTGQRSSGLPPVQDLSRAQDRTTNYQVEGAAEQELGLYGALLAVEPAERVQKLADLLHWDRNLPPDAGVPTSLADCLRSLRPADRYGVIAQYWHTREQVARYQALSEQWEQLNTLRSVAIDQRDQPGMAGAHVRLQAARRSAHAALLDAEATLLGAEFELTQATGRMTDTWLLPSTLPCSGSGPAGDQGGLRDGRQYAATVRLARATLDDQAEAVIQADAQRAALVSRAREGISADPEKVASDEPVRLDSAVRAVGQQNAQALAMLGDLTAYNMAIARFVLANAPVGISADELSQRLVATRRADGDS